MYEVALRLDKTREESLSTQIYEYFKQEIISGNLNRTEKIPSKRQLAQSLSCSLNTVQAAYNQLADEGYIMPKAKSGYFVASLEGIVYIQPKQQDAKMAEKRTDPFAFDFSHQGVDFDHFPFSIWRRLTKEVIDETDKELLRTGDPHGLPALRSTIARYLHQSRGVNCSPDQIIISSGTEYLLQLLTQLFDRQAVYAIENPGYEKLAMIFRSSRAEYKPIILDRSGMRPEALEESAATIACITPSHQFPTGQIMPVNRRIQLLNWASDRPGRYIIEDDYDSEFRYTGKPIPSLQGLDKEGKVIYMGALSKSLSPALRVSYMVLPQTLLQAYHEKLDFYICPVPTIEQKTLQRFMDEGHFERHLNRMRNLYRQKRERLVTAIRDLLPEARIEGAASGLHFVLRAGNCLSEPELVQRASEWGVNVYGFSRYSSAPTSDAPRDAIVLGFATLRLDEIEDAVMLLKRAWTI